MSRDLRDHTPCSRHSGVLTLLFGVILFLTPVERPFADNLTLTITPGIGHDRFTETFYLDDSTSVSADSLARIKTTEDGLRETYVSLGLGLQKGHWQVASTHYATDAAWRNISYGQGRITSGRLRTDVYGRLEWKGTDGEDSLASAYTFYRIDVKPRLRLNDNWWAVIRGDWQQADYKQNSPYTADYHRERARAGIQYVGDQLQFLDFSAGAAHRAVPDSSRLDYNETCLNCDATGWYVGHWRVGAEFAFADRAFDTGSGGDDHQRWSMYARGDLDWYARWRVYWFGEWQYWNYAFEDASVYDVTDWRVEGSARARFAGDQWEAGGILEWRTEQPVGTVAEGNEYQQWAAGPIVSWNPSVYVWSEAGLRVGSRDYSSASLIYDDYSFWEVNAQVDMALAAGPDISLVVSYLNEMYDDPLRDTDQLYLSASLRLPFQP